MQRPPNIALQLTGTALHLSLLKSLARLQQRSKAAPAAERNVSPSTGLHAPSDRIPEPTHLWFY